MAQDIIHVRSQPGSCYVPGPDSVRLVVATPLLSIFLTMKQFFVFSAALLLSVAAHTQSTEPTHLSTEEVLTLIKGKTIQTQNTRWGGVRLQFEENGTVWASGNGFNHRGKWKVEEGKLCLDGQKFDFDGCGVVRKAANAIQHLWPQGHLHFDFPAP